MNSKTARHESIHQNRVQPPARMLSSLPSQATLRFLGHMGRNGGNLWALKAAEHYFPEGHVMLRAYESRCQRDRAGIQGTKDSSVVCSTSITPKGTSQVQKLNPLALTERPEFWCRRAKLGVMISKRR